MTTKKPTSKKTPIKTTAKKPATKKVAVKTTSTEQVLAKFSNEAHEVAHVAASTSLGNVVKPKKKSLWKRIIRLGF